MTFGIVGFVLVVKAAADIAAAVDQIVDRVAAVKVVAAFAPGLAHFAVDRLVVVAVIDIAVELTQNYQIGFQVEVQYCLLHHSTIEHSQPSAQPTEQPAVLPSVQHPLDPEMKIVEDMGWVQPQYWETLVGLASLLQAECQWEDPWLAQLL